MCVTVPNLVALGQTVWLVSKAPYPAFSDYNWTGLTLLNGFSFLVNFFLSFYFFGRSVN